MFYIRNFLFKNMSIITERYELLLLSIFIVPVNSKSTRTCGINLKTSSKCLHELYTDFVLYIVRRQGNKDNQRRLRLSSTNKYTWHSLVSNGQFIDIRLKETHHLHSIIRCCILIFYIYDMFKCLF